MRPIDKKLNLATEYKSWIEAIEKENKSHPEYHASHKYYKDVAANLLWVQGGLCAYTEMFLIDPDNVKSELWREGRFPERPQSFGELDHYDSDLKTHKGWDWNNLFMVLGIINKRKGTKKVFILKPDAPGFNPFYYLEYDSDTHQFTTNRERNEEERQEILANIDILGLNYGAVISERKNFLNPIISEINYGFDTLENCRKKITRFYTAFEMAVSQIPK